MIPIDLTQRLLRVEPAPSVSRSDEPPKADDEELAMAHATERAGPEIARGHAFEDAPPQQIARAGMAWIPGGTFLIGSDKH